MGVHSDERKSWANKIDLIFDHVSHAPQLRSCNYYFHLASSTRHVHNNGISTDQLTPTHPHKP